MQHKFGIGHELATLGTLIMLDIPEKEIANLIAEVDDYLKAQKGFDEGLLAITHGAEEKRVYAAQLVLNQYGPEKSKADGTVFESIQAVNVILHIFWGAYIDCVSFA